MKGCELIGKLLLHSFSPRFFNAFFEELGIEAEDKLIELHHIGRFKPSLQEAYRHREAASLCKHICKPYKPKHSPKLAKELPHLRPKKNFKIFFTTLQKNKTFRTQARQKSTRQMTETNDIKMVVTHDRQKHQPIIGFGKSVGTVLRMKVFRKFKVCTSNEVQL